MKLLKMALVTFITAGSVGAMNNPDSYDQKQLKKMIVFESMNDSKLQPSCPQFVDLPQVVSLVSVSPRIEAQVEEKQERQEAISRLPVCVVSPQQLPKVQEPSQVWQTLCFFANVCKKEG
jgi:hypothetical protein